MDDWMYDQMFSQQIDFDLDNNPDVSPGKYRLKRQSQFEKNPFYYHRKMACIVDGEIIIKHITEKAYLFKTNKGLFWCPKSLIKKNYDDKPCESWLVHKSFKPQFIKEE
jgi:hypothetical protein